MLKVLAACGNGMGSSLIIKMKIEKVLKELGIDANVHHSSVGQAKTEVNNFDLVIVSNMFVDSFQNAGNTKIIGVVNLLSDEELVTKIKEALSL